MKKNHRALLSILLVLALLATLPLTAMAENIGEEGQDPSTTVVLENNKAIDNNYGTVNVNRPEATYNSTGIKVDKPGTIENNHGIVESNQMDQNTGEVPGQIINNHDTVKENSSGKLDGSNTQAGIVNNYGTVELNDYNVNDQSQKGVIKYNASTGTVQTNKGFIGHSTNDGELPEGAGNAGYVGENYGVVYNDGGTVQENKASRADYPYQPAEVVNYSGKVVDNYGNVWNEAGTVTTNKAGGYVCNEAGGIVENNSGYVQNAGEVKINNVDGTVYSYAIWDEGWDNITEYKEGTIGTNYGTYEIYTSTNPSDPPTTVYYGVHYENDQGEKEYLGQFKEGDDVKVEDLKNTREGWKITGIQEVIEYRGVNELADDGAEEIPGTTVLNSFKIAAPTQLKLLWERITSIFKPAASSGGGGAEAVELSTGKRYIGIGSVIFINEKPYKIIELKADSYVVVSFDALPDEDVKDLDALFLSLFTPEQQALIQNYRQLLDEEDVLTVFGKPGNHPVFEVDDSLVE